MSVLKISGDHDAKQLVMMGMYNFKKGYKMLQRAYKKTSQLEEERQVENPQSFEQFVEPFAYSVDDPIVRYFFTNFVDRELHIDILNKMIISDHVRIVGDIVENWSSCMLFVTFYIPF
jgi:hypothetical protein